MKTKPKRIRALRMNITPHDAILTNEYDDTEPCYILRQSDVRALAEQLQKDYHNAWFDGTYDKKYPNAKTDSMLYALRFAGITPGKGAK